MRALVALAALLALAPLAPLSGASDSFVARGQFVAGTPTAYLLRDACVDPAQEGIDSSCVRLPPHVAGRPYDMRVWDDAGLIADVAACYYSAGLVFSECNPPTGRVPPWAEHLSVSSLGGANVRWIFVA